MFPYWPSTVPLTAALLGRPALGNEVFAEMKKSTTDHGGVIYEFVDPGDKVPLHFGRFADSSTGLAFSVAYGTCFLVPIPETPKSALEDNPFCLDPTSGPLAGALRNETRSFAETVRVIPATKTLSWLFHALMPTHLVPGGRAVSELRRLVSTALPPILSRLGVGNVCTLRADNPGPGWITTPLEFEAECTNLAAELRTGAHAAPVASVATHITRRISLLIHIHYLLVALPGREKAHCWPVLTMSAPEERAQPEKPSRPKSVELPASHRAVLPAPHSPERRARVTLGTQEASERAVLPAPHSPERRARMTLRTQEASERAAAVRAALQGRSEVATPSQRKA
jgi:hypothetical protein